MADLASRSQFSHVGRRLAECLEAGTSIENDLASEPSLDTRAYIQVFGVRRADSSVDSYDSGARGGPTAGEQPAVPLAGVRQDLPVAPLHLTD